MVLVIFTNRMQFASTFAKSSGPFGKTYGVPQGSVPEPLLLLLFINDLPNVSKRPDFYLFADNTSLYYESETPDDVI